MKQYQVKLLKDIETVVTFRDRDGNISHETPLTMSAGVRTFKTFKEAVVWKLAIASEHGADAVKIAKHNSSGEIVLWD